MSVLPLLGPSSSAGDLSPVSTVHLVTLLVSVFRSDQEGAQFSLPVWAAPLLLLLSLLYPLFSSFIFAYRHRKIRLEEPPLAEVAMVDLETRES